TMSPFKLKALVAVLAALFASACGSSQPVAGEAYGPGAPSANALPAAQKAGKRIGVTLKLPKRETLDEAFSMQTDGYELTITPEGNCVDGTAVRETQKWNGRSLPVEIAQGCAYFVKVQLGKLEAGGGALQQIFL